MFYVNPTHALEKFSANPAENKFRLGGLVLEGSVVQPTSSPEMEFVVTDLVTDNTLMEGFVKPFTKEIKMHIKNLINNKQIIK